jgi:hypothetical protein
MHCAFTIRSQNAYAGRLKSLVEEFRTRMPIRVGLSDRDNSDLRSHCSEKFLRSGVLSSVMTNLQHVGP